MFQIITIIAKSLIHNFFVEHNLELFNCEDCENKFKTEDHLASHGAMIHNQRRKYNLSIVTKQIYALK